jgi:hypothetical protein
MAALGRLFHIWNTICLEGLAYRLERDPSAKPVGKVWI